MPFEQSASRLDNLKAIKIALKQDSNKSGNHLIVPEFRTNGVQERFAPYSYQGGDAAGIWSNPTVSDQLEILQNCLIVDPGKILQSTPQVKEFPESEKPKMKSLKVPALMESIKSITNISPEVQEIFSDDICLQIALHHIINIIGIYLQNSKIPFQIKTELARFDEVNSWRYINISILIPQEYNKEISKSWKNISSLVSKFYDSLSQTSDFSKDIIINLRKFIYLKVKSEE